jgi:hypothetical protein
MPDSVAVGEGEASVLTDNEVEIRWGQVDDPRVHLLGLLRRLDDERGVSAEDPCQQVWFTGGAVLDDRDGDREVGGQSSQELFESLDTAGGGRDHDQVVTARAARRSPDRLGCVDDLAVPPHGCDTVLWVVFWHTGPFSERPSLSCVLLTECMSSTSLNRAALMGRVGQHP